MNSEEHQQHSRKKSQQYRFAEQGKRAKAQAIGRAVSVFRKQRP
jgi:hypothetical protein